MIVLRMCNVQLNYFLGARAAEEGRESRYPDVDFCKGKNVLSIIGLFHSKVTDQACFSWQIPR